MDKLLLAMRALGPARILSLFIGLAALVAILGIVGANVGKPGLALLYGGLAPEEAVSISTWLDGRGVDYDVRDDGSVYVPSNQVGELRLQAAGQGLVGPSNTGYEVFDKSSGFGTTSFVQNINARRALEGELARTITALPAVSSARVHLVLPERRLFDRNASKPSAAVALTLGGRILADGQVGNIAALVASAVPNLTTESVTVIDQAGNMLFNGKAQSADATSGGDIKQQIEQRYAQSITNLIERVTGPGKVSVSVAADVNLERIEEQSELYDPTQQVVRSEQRVEETGEQQNSFGGGVAGLTGNIPQEDAGAGAGGNNSRENDSRVEETINYEISRTLRNRIQAAGAVQKLSVAVLVEGKYIASEEEGGEATYQAYTEDELAQFATLIRGAIGFDVARGDTLEVLDMQFSQPPTPEAIEEPLLGKSDILQLAQYAVLLIGMILVIFMVVRPTLNTISKALATLMPPPPPPMPAANATAPMPADGSGGGDTEVSIDKVQGRVRESVVKQVNEVIDQHPEESLNTVRAWMSDAKGGPSQSPEPQG